MIIKIIKYFLLSSLFCYHVHANSAHNELIEKLDKIYPLEIYFEQIVEDNKSIKGWMVLGGKGKVRTEFQPPNSLVIIGTGRWLILYDVKFDRTTYLPMKTGILNSLLNPKSLKDYEKVYVSKKINKNLVTYSISSKEKTYDGRLEILFNKENGVEILGWKIIDKNNKVTRVNVTDSIQLNEEDVRSKPFFSFQEINRNNYKFFLGPYIRELKTIPKPGRL